MYMPFFASHLLPFKKTAQLPRSLLVTAMIAVIFWSADSKAQVDMASVSGHVGFVNPDTSTGNWLTSANYAGSVVVLRGIPGTAVSVVNGTAVVPPPDVASYSTTIDVTNSTTVAGTASISWEKNTARGLEKYSYNLGESPYSSVPSEVAPCSAPANQTTTCPLREEACVMTATLSLTGSGVNMLAEGSLTDPEGYILCGISAAIGGNEQASARDLIFTRSELVAGQAVSLLVRKNGPHDVNITCSARPVDPDFGFELDDNGRIPLRFATQGSCGGLNADIPVEPKSGSLRGYFDIVGETEVSAKVSITAPPRSTVPPTADAGAVLTAADTWQISNAPVGDSLEVAASATLEGKRQIVRLPMLRPPNPSVSVQEGQATDLGSLLITRSQRLNGQVYLYDPAGFNDLADLKLGPFATDAGYGTSYTLATGDANIAAGGVSGSGGQAWGSWQGNVDGSGTSAILDYELVLTGLGTSGSMLLDGSGTLPAPWDVNHVSAFFTDSDRTAVSSARLEVDNHYILAPGENVEVPPIHLCLSSYGLNMAIDPASGEELAFPGVSLSERTGSTPSNSADFPQTAAWAYGYASGTPNSWGAASHEAHVRATVADSSTFTVRPSVRIRPAGDTGTGTQVQFDAFDITIPLSCGSRREDCLNIDSGAVQTSLLSVWIEPMAYCQSAAPILTVHMRDEGGNYIPHATWTVRSGNTVVDSGVLCTNCIPLGDTGLKTFYLDLATDVNFGPSMPAGTMVVEIDATSTGQCNAGSEYAFEIPQPPASIQCPPPLTIVGDGSPIARDDPQLSGFNATVTGGCATQPPVSNDAPSEFVAGTTPVIFTSGALNCTSSVTVEGAPPFVMRHGQSVEVIRPDWPPASLQVGHNVRDAAISPDGTLVVAGYQDTTGGGLYIRNLETGTEQHITRPRPVTGVAFSRTNNHILFVEQDVPPKLFWWNGASSAFIGSFQNIAAPFTGTTRYDVPPRFATRVATPGGNEEIAAAYSAVKFHNNTGTTKAGLWVMFANWDGTTFLPSPAGPVALSELREIPVDIDFVGPDARIITDKKIYRKASSGLWQNTPTPSSYTTGAPAGHIAAAMAGTSNKIVIRGANASSTEIPLTSVCHEGVCLGPGKFELAFSDAGAHVAVSDGRRIALLSYDGSAITVLKVWDIQGMNPRFPGG